MGEILAEKHSPFKPRPIFLSRLQLMNILTESAYTESKTLRDCQIVDLSDEKVEEILVKIKSLYFTLWQGTGTTTTSALSEYYEVSVETIQKVIQRHREELKSDGLKSIRGRALKDVADSLSISKKTPRLTIWTPRAALRLGMLLRDSPIAIAVRTSLLDMAEKVVPIVNNQNQNLFLLPSARQQLETVELGMNLLGKLGGWDERTNILLKDRVRNILFNDRFLPSQANSLEPSLKPATTEPRRLEYPVSDRAITLGYKPSNSQLQQIGKKAARLYQEKHNSKPPQREQFVAGTTRLVNVYGHDDLELLDNAIAIVMAHSSSGKKKG